VSERFRDFSGNSSAPIFESWRRQVRLMKAVELLLKGSSVKEVVFAVGYRQSGAFIEAFRRT
jgi:AraC-like DNA-binding protein